MSDKLREAAELFYVSASLASDGGVGQFLKALSGLRAALADSATKDGGGVLDAQTVERSAEPGTHGGASTDRETRPLDAPPEPTEEIARKVWHEVWDTGDAPIDIQMADEEFDTYWVALRAALNADNLLIEKLPSSITPEVLVEALGGKSTSPEPTDEMVEDGMQAMGYEAERRPFGGARERFIKGLKAALATWQKGEG